jgi:hypothetical protein
MALHQGARIPGIALQVQDAAGVRIEHRVGGHLLEARHADDAAFAILALHAARELDDDLFDRSGLAGLHGGRESLVRSVPIS